VKPGERFPDLDLTDHTGRQRTLSEGAGGDPLALFSSRVRLMAGRTSPRGRTRPARGRERARLGRHLHRFA